MDWSGSPRGNPDWEWIGVPEGVSDPRKARISVFLLGPLRVFRDGEPVVGGWRRKSLELLAYLGVHPHGVSKDQILEALWPEGDPGLTQKYLWRTVSNLRCKLRGLSAMRVIFKMDDSYALDLHEVWVDAIAFDQAARRARLVPDPASLLSHSCDIYKGGLCEARYYHWATISRERLNSLFVRTARDLAIHLSEIGDAQGALDILDRAIAAAPYDEDLYRRAMILEARRNQVGDAARLYRRLRRLLLIDLQVEPSGETIKTYESLVRASVFETP